MLLFYENSMHSKSMFPLCFSDTLMLEPMILPFAPFVKSPYGVPYNLRQTSPWKSWRKRLRLNAERARACNERGSIDVVVLHTCPDALISCLNRSCQCSIKRKDASTHNKVSRQTSQVNNASRTPPWPTRNFILRRLAQG